MTVRQGFGKPKNRENINKNRQTSAELRYRQNMSKNQQTSARLGQKNHDFTIHNKIRTFATLVHTVWSPMQFVHTTCQPLAESPCLPQLFNLLKCVRKPVS